MTVLRFQSPEYAPKDRTLAAFDEPFKPLRSGAGQDERDAALNQLGGSVNKLHDCVHAGFDAVAREAAKLAAALAVEKAEAEAFRAEVRSNQDVLLKALKIDKPPVNGDPPKRTPGKSLATMDRATLAAWVAAVAVVAPLIARIGDGAFKPLLAAAGAAWAALIASH